MKRFPHYIQLDAMDCGPSCLRMIAKYYGKTYSLQTLRARSFITREGVSMLGISDAAEFIGFRTSGVRITFKQLVEDVPLPCILHWNQNHFVVCYDIRKKKDGYWVSVADPASQLCRDVETLGQRIKRARISASGQPPAGTSSTPPVVLSSPDSSPQPSPQRESITHPLSTCIMHDALVLTLPWM